MENFEVNVYDVLSVSTFKRKNGMTGQKVKCKVPDRPEYSFTYECCDLEEFDFSKMQKNKSYVCLAVPIIRLENVKCNDGNLRYLNIPSYRLISVVSEI